MLYGKISYAIEKHLKSGSDRILLIDSANKKKRVVAQNIENKRWKTFTDYQNEFDYS